MDPRLAFARELERRDAAVGERLELFGRLSNEVDRIRLRAAELLAFFERLSAEREQVESATRAAKEALERARRALAEADAAPGAGDRAAAERDLAAQEVAVRRAEDWVERTAARGAALERDAAESQDEARALARAAVAAARELEHAPRVGHAAVPGPGLPDVLDWAARAHAAILVARSGLEAERDRISREANEFGSSVLGEPLQATNVSLVRQRVEERLGART